MKKRFLAICAPLLFLPFVWFVSAGSQTSKPEHSSQLIFSHDLHVAENEIECDACHTEISESAFASDANLPVMDACAECHDVEDEDNCGQCHVDPEDPQELENPQREFSFNHQAHLAQNVDCIHCHKGVLKQPEGGPGPIPGMGLCLDCHDGIETKDDCELCHGENITLADIHPPDWRRKHGDEATLDRDFCVTCHKKEEECLACHRGDNLRGRNHELNYRLTHGLDASSKNRDCARCHDRKAFCNSCHEAEIRIPLLHSSISWRQEHGKAARRDIEDCAACHDSNDPTCARSGCHNDFDGVRGTDPKIHIEGEDLGGEGPWHDDDGYFCFQCHSNTHSPGNGFCGYCHR